METLGLPASGAKWPFITGRGELMQSSAEEVSLVCGLCFNDLYFNVLRSTEAPGALVGMTGLCEDLAFRCYSSLGGVIMLQLTHKQEKACRLSAVFNFTLDKKR